LRQFALKPIDLVAQIPEFTAMFCVRLLEKVAELSGPKQGNNSNHRNAQYHSGNKKNEGVHVLWPRITKTEPGSWNDVVCGVNSAKAPTRRLTMTIETMLASIPQGERISLHEDQSRHAHPAVCFLPFDPVIRSTATVGPPQEYPTEGA
jgi:hypothetical protein